MSKFNVGDRVRITKEFPEPVYHGRIGTIVTPQGSTQYPISVDLDELPVTANMQPHYLKESEVEKINSFEVGDRVMLTEEYFEQPAGSVGTVTNIDPIFIRGNHHDAIQVTFDYTGRVVHPFTRMLGKVTKPERKDWTALIDEADVIIAATLEYTKHVSSGAVPEWYFKFKELRDALVEESYRD